MISFSFTSPGIPAPSPGRRPERPVRADLAGPSAFAWLSLLCAIMLISSHGNLRAQCLVENPSFETLDLTTVMDPGWEPDSSWPASPHGDIALPGVPGWFTRSVSPDVFWTPLYVPSNFMGHRQPAFDGGNYAGISSGLFRPGTSFSSEILSGTLTAPPTPGHTYEVRARFSMSAIRPNPTVMQLSLSGPGGTLVVGNVYVDHFPDWTLFAQKVMIPAGAIYDRILIQAIVDPRFHPGGCYTYVDSVDVCEATTCYQLRSRLVPHSSPGDSTGCCYDLLIDETDPAPLMPPAAIRVTTTAPVQIVGPTATPGWSAASISSTQATWTLAPRMPFPTGVDLNIGHYCVFADGISPQRHIIEFLAGDNSVLCRDTIYTDCDTPVPSCLNLTGGSILCDSLDAGGHRRYTINFDALPLSAPRFVTGTTLVLRSPQGTVSPSTVALSGIMTHVGPITFTDTPPTDPAACIIGEYHMTTHEKDSILCRDTICFTLPDCPSNCCDNFTKQITGAALSYLNGTITLNGCALAGPGTIRRFSAAIIAAQSRTITTYTPPGGGPSFITTTLWHTVAGDISSGTLASPSSLAGPYYVAGASFGREVVWGGTGSPTCTSFSPCIPLKLVMHFPDPPSASNSTDELRFTVRYSFTDCQCRTCDTIVTYTLARKYTDLPFHGPWINFGGPTISLLRVDMSSETNGTFTVTLPEAAEDAPAIRIVGLSFRPLGVALASMIKQGQQVSLPISGNEATSDMVLNGGESALFHLVYSNSSGMEEIPNLVRFRYIMLSDTLDTIMTDTVSVIGHAVNGGHGDQVTEENAPEAHDVHTYVLHVEATNANGEDVHGIRVTTGGGTELIAVGPVGNGSDALIVPGGDGEGNSVVQTTPSTWVVQDLPAGNTITPIYLTFAGAADGASIEYQTLNGDGSVITGGSVTLGSPLRIAGVGTDEKSQETSLWPIYPNPTATAATVAFHLRSPGSIRLSIRDMQGNEVLRRVDGDRFDAGDHLVPVKTDGLATGTYMVILTVDGRSYSRALTVVR